MSGGPLFPYSLYLEDGELFDNVHVGAGANSKYDQGIGVEASLGSDADLHIRFQVPSTLPTGTGKLVMRSIANAVAGNAKVNPKWASVANGENPSGTALNAEGTQTVTWIAGDNDDYKDTKVTLDADTLVAGEVVVMDVTFETTNWTLAQVSTWAFYVIWE